MFVGISFSFDNLQSEQLHLVSFKAYRAFRMMIFSVCASSIQKRDNSFYVCTFMIDFLFFSVLAVPHRTLKSKNSELD